MNELELKLEHYKQRVAQLSLESEEKISDLRVELTLKVQEVEELKKKLEELNEETEDTAK